jgi:hypothetical protein
MSSRKKKKKKKGKRRSPVSEQDGFYERKPDPERGGDRKMLSSLVEGKRW